MGNAEGGEKKRLSFSRSQMKQLLPPPVLYLKAQISYSSLFSTQNLPGVTVSVYFVI